MDFNQVINETKRPVLAAIRRYLDTSYFYAIDDVAQEVYLRAYRALEQGKLREASKLRSYLYTIARNESLRMNARCRREEVKAEKFLETEKRRISVNPAVAEDSADRLAEIKDSLAAIPLHYAQVVELAMAGLSGREIVEKLGIKPGTVKSRLSRGLALLREKIA